MTTPDWSQPPAPGQQPAGAWQQPGRPAQAWGPSGQQGPGGQHGPGPAWGAPAPAARGGSSVALLVLAPIAAVLEVVGAFVPTYVYPGGIGTYSPLFSRFGDAETQFQAGGLNLLVGAALLVVGALVARSRAPLGCGLLLLGAGIVAVQGVGLLLVLLQSALGGDGLDLSLGGVLLILAMLAAVAAAVLALVRLARVPR